MAHGFSPSLHHLRNLGMFLVTICLLVQGGASNKYGAKCRKNLECVETNFCDEGLCKCQSFKNKLSLIFNDQTRTCESSVGSICTLSDGPKGRSWKCVKDAQCKGSANPNLPDTLGVCVCNSGFLEKYGLCVKEVTLEETYQEVRARQSSKGAVAPWSSSSIKLLKSNPIVILVTILLFV